MEKWDAYDVNRNKLDFLLTRGEKIPDGAYYISVHIVYYNSKGEILVQRRSDTKEVFPSLWAYTGGAAQAGETSLEACMREGEEEMGFPINPDDAELIISFRFMKSFNDVYLVKTDVGIEDVHVQESEVAEAAWLDRDSFLKLMKDPEKAYQHQFNELLFRILDNDPRVWGK